MQNPDYSFFILVSYVIALVSLSALLLTSWLRHKKQQALLESAKGKTAANIEK